MKILNQNTLYFNIKLISTMLSLDNIEFIYFKKNIVILNFKEVKNNGVFIYNKYLEEVI